MNRHRQAGPTGPFLPRTEVAQVMLRKQQLPQLEIIPADRLFRECEFSPEM
jgi:hypothetical protein